MGQHHQTCVVSFCLEFYQYAHTHTHTHSLSLSLYNFYWGKAFLQHVHACNLFSLYNFYWGKAFLQHVLHAASVDPLISLNSSLGPTILSNISYLNFLSHSHSQKVLVGDFQLVA